MKLDIRKLTFGNWYVNKRFKYLVNCGTVVVVLFFLLCSKEESQGVWGFTSSNLMYFTHFHGICTKIVTDNHVIGWCFQSNNQHSSSIRRTQLLLAHHPPSGCSWHQTPGVLAEENPVLWGGVWVMVLFVSSKSWPLLCLNSPQTESCKPIWFNVHPSQSCSLELSEEKNGFKVLGHELWGC